MDRVGHIHAVAPKRVIGLATKKNSLIRSWHRGGAEPLFSQQRQGFVVECDRHKRRGAAGQSPVTLGPGVFALDQVKDGAGAVAPHLRGPAMHGSGKAAADDQKAVLVARNDRFDDCLGGNRLGTAKGDQDTSLIGDAYRDGPSLEPLGRLDHEGKADGAGSLQGFLLGSGDLLARQRKSRRSQDPAGCMLGGSDKICDRQGSGRL